MKEARRTVTSKIRMVGSRCTEYDKHESYSVALYLFSSSLTILFWELKVFEHDWKEVLGRRLHWLLLMI
uniref:Ovule protein n=1 Tax=Caenorhabditis tropicalis TaxID=1561998 RepID=A0A1I7TX31_9PELO